MAVPPGDPASRRRYGYYRRPYVGFPGYLTMLLVGILAYWLFSLLIPALILW